MCDSFESKIMRRLKVYLRPSFFEYGKGRRLKQGL